MKATRRFSLAVTFLCIVGTLGGCHDRATGPVRVVAIAGGAQVVNPNRDPVGPASALLLEAVAQGLVRFDAAGEIEPALAQSWIVSDDGLRYTFRIRRTLWARGEPVTAAQVVERLNAALSRSSRNNLKPVLGAIDQIEAMTDRVLEIRLKSPRPNLLQLLAQPEMAVIANGEGTGPYRLGGEQDGAVRLVPPPSDEDEAGFESSLPEIMLRAEPAAPRAIAGFMQDQTDLVTGGTLADLPYLQAAEPGNGQTVFDPVRGLFGLAFARAEGPLADAPFRQALSMSIDRDAIAARFRAPGIQPRLTVLPPALAEVAQPAGPEWAAVPLATRRELAARIVAEFGAAERPRLRIAVPEGLGYRIVFAHLRRDWRFIGVDAVPVAAGAAADLRLIDEVAPADLVPWYLRHFVCAASPICDESVDQALEAARVAATRPERQALLVQADQDLNRITAFIPIGSPVRWSLRSPRLNGFRPNVFGRHALTELIQDGQ